MSRLVHKTLTQEGFDGEVKTDTVSSDTYTFEQFSEIAHECDIEQIRLEELVHASESLTQIAESIRTEGLHPQMHRLALESVDSNLQPLAVSLEQEGQSAFDRIMEIIYNLWNKVKEAIVNTINKLKDFIARLRNSVAELYKQVSSNFDRFDKLKKELDEEDLEKIRSLPSSDRQIPVYEAKTLQIAGELNTDLIFSGVDTVTSELFPVNGSYVTVIDAFYEQLNLALDDYSDDRSEIDTFFRNIQQTTQELDETTRRIFTGKFLDSTARLPGNKSVRAPVTREKTVGKLNVHIVEAPEIIDDPTYSSRRQIQAGTKIEVLNIDELEKLIHKSKKLAFSINEGMDTRDRVLDKRSNAQQLTDDIFLSESVQDAYREDKKRDVPDEYYEAAYRGAIQILQKDYAKAILDIDRYAFNYLRNLNRFIERCINFYEEQSK